MTAGYSVARLFGIKLMPCLHRLRTGPPLRMSICFCSQKRISTFMMLMPFESRISHSAQSHECGEVGITSGNPMEPRKMVRTKATLIFIMGDGIKHSIHWDATSGQCGIYLWVNLEIRTSLCFQSS